MTEERDQVSITRTQGNLMLVLLIGILGTLIFSATYPAEPPPIESWEYRVEAPSDYSFLESINRWGDEGWELASARRATSKHSTASYEVILKRPYWPVREARLAENEQEPRDQHRGVSVVGTKRMEPKKDKKPKSN